MPSVPVRHLKSQTNKHTTNSENRCKGYRREKRSTAKCLTDNLPSWILLENKAARDAMQAKLKENGIPSMIYYPRGLHQQEAYKWMGLDDTMYPNTIEATSRCLSLPMHPYLKENDVDMICKVLLAD